jgi:hypothetical protein
MSARDPKAATKNKMTSLVCQLVVSLGAVLIPVSAMAQDAAAPPMAALPPGASSTPVMPEGTAKTVKAIGGHIGIAVPLLMVDHPTKNIGNQTNIADPIGVTVKLNDKVAVDFEVIVASHIGQNGAATTLTIDPGVIYNLGPVAAGLRAKWDIGAPPNIGVIPLINRGIVDLGPATWFIEAAFPITYVNKNVNFDIVLHTGLGF